MVSLGGPVSRDQVPNDEFEALPAGEYTVSIDSIEPDTHPDIGQQFLSLKLQIVSGEYSGRFFRDRWHGLIPGTAGAFSELGGPKFDVEKASQVRLGTMMDAVGLSTLEDTNQFLGKIVVVKVNNKDGWNNVKKYSASGGVQAQTTPANTFGGSASAPAQPAASGSPWGAKS